MVAESLVDPWARIRRQPRNLWSRLAAATDLLAMGQTGAAREIIEGISYLDDLPAEVLDIWNEHLRIGDQLRGVPAPLNRPAQYTANEHGRFLTPFRKLDAAKPVPKPFPWAMALPTPVGRGNDHGFLDSAVSAIGADLDRLPHRLGVVWVTPPGGAVEALPGIVSALRRQVGAGAVGLRLLAFLPEDDGTDLPDATFPVDRTTAQLLSPGGISALSALVAASDSVLFLSGAVALDDLLLARALRYGRLSDRAVLPLVPMSADPPHPQEAALITPFTPPQPAGSLTSRFPFREINGFNMFVPAALLREVGLPDPRFTSPTYAARELAYRFHARGAWFLPVRVEVLSDWDDIAPNGANRELFKALCPNHWDRKRDEYHEVPKVSIYIPAYNASKYIERAVESVLSQDVADLDVCIANDGSRDGTLALLERLYAGERRVRWTDNPNGGIGFASNAAIRMSRSLYIGQLDSDDRLKPGAVRRLMETLDESPALVCAYSSCERIDAAGTVTQNEYSWPVFSREKMMITSIAHHFRMFRRQTWERSSRFREDIVNGVDYDIFLKMSELGDFRHVEETLYQRRWHGENTSHVNEAHQTTNTHRVQREALRRQGLSRYWDVHVSDPEKPRNVTYRRRDGTPLVVFWPDYSRSNPYQRLLYAKAAARAEFVAGDIDAAIRVIESGEARPQDVVFHLHWLNPLFLGRSSEDEARTVAERFAERLTRLHDAGGRILWTIHNTLTHDTPYAAIEAQLSEHIVSLADAVHLHSAGSAAEVEADFAVPAGKVRVSRHGHYIGAYPDAVPRDAARAMLGIGADDDVILFTGLVRPYKGVDQLIQAFRRVLAERPQARLLIAGQPWYDPLAEAEPALTEAERSRILTSGRFVGDAELQLFFRAADVAVYPYLKSLTSGSLMLALSFGVPTVIPRTAMTADVLQGQPAGHLYDPQSGAEGLEAGLRGILAAKDAGRLPRLAQAARRLAERLDWPDFADLLPG